MIKRIVKLSICEGKEEDFLNIFKNIAPDIASFDGCSSLQIVNVANNKNVFFTISEWYDDNALERYRNSGFFRSSWQQIKKFFCEKPEAWSTNIISNY